MRTILKKTGIVLPVFMFLLPATEGWGQYFGRNKVNYNRFDFTVVQTPHFSIYTYLSDTAKQNEFARQAEVWYSRHQSVFRDTFQEPNPLILYNAHGHFQQTQAISGLIDVGTGGVTEGLKNRVVMPYMESKTQTDHVLGHELVHAFQYNLLKNSDSLSFSDAMNNLPLWMVEGLAEYLSIGSKDAHTALWLRDAVANNRLPSLKELTAKPDQYFPYRWGHAFWAYVAGTWGDTIIRPLFLQTARKGYKDALKSVLGVDEKIFSGKWRAAILEKYLPYKDHLGETAAGDELIDVSKAGDLNIVPSISPDGKWMAYWTEKDGFTLSLYLANAETGKTIRKLSFARLESHIDNYNSYESSIAWSPDSRFLAYVAFAKGHNQLIIAERENVKNIRFIDLPQLDGISNPTWSADGSGIVFSGLKNGQSALYMYHFKTEKTTALTHNVKSALLPSFSWNGKWIAFTTEIEEPGENGTFKSRRFTIALLNRETGSVQLPELFERANNVNPVFGKNDSLLFFLSDRDGFRNLYSYELNTGKIYQHTAFFTGITGITFYSPAISTSRNGRLLYNYYNNNQYTICVFQTDRLNKLEINKSEIHPDASVLPFTGKKVEYNEGTPAMATSHLLLSDSSIKRKPYRPTLQLDFLSNTGTGISTSRYGTGLAGGVNAMFSDMLGTRQLFGALSLNGEIVDAAGQFVYFNQKNRINWGVGYSHIPYYRGYAWLSVDSVMLGNKKMEVLTNNTDIFRTFEDQFSLMGVYPFSQTRRAETGVSYSIYYNSHERFTEYYDSLGYLIGYKHKKNLPAEKGFKTGNIYMAFVGDNSQFGVTSPLSGYRYRLETGWYLGSVRANQLLADYRHYFRTAPVTIATRAMFYGQFGKDITNGILPPLYIGYPWLVRGYENVNFTERNKASLTINELAGNKTFVANAEVRLPFTGPKRVSLIHSRMLLTELSLFTDAGSAWGWTGNINKKGKLIASSGLSIRFNFFGYMIIEPYYVIPWQNGGFHNTSIGLNFLPGW